MINKPFLSVIIPLYNEENRLKNLSKIYKYLDTLGRNYEVLLINDGSIDKTGKRLESLKKRFKFQLISYTPNRGKGFAIKSGMLAARGKYILFADIDLSTPIEEFNKFLPLLKRSAVLIGSRKTKGSQLNKRQPYFREILGIGFTFLSQKILDLNITDFTCGFKCFSKEAAEKTFFRQKINRWGFDTEILFISKKMGLSVKEVPVIWKNDIKTRVKLPQDIITSLADLAKIRYNDFMGLYD